MLLYSTGTCPVWYKSLIFYALLKQSNRLLQLMPVYSLWAITAMMYRIHRKKAARNFHQLKIFTFTKIVNNVSHNFIDYQNYKFFCM